jgi:hypothetical protein
MKEDIYNEGDEESQHSHSWISSRGIKNFLFTTVSRTVIGDVTS